MNKDNDNLVHSFWIFGLCTVIGVLLAACQHELAGGLLIMVGVCIVVGQLPFDEVFLPRRRRESEITHVHQYFHNTYFYQPPRYDRITEGCQLDLRRGSLTRVTRWE
jgi:hypothetical protein